MNETFPIQREFNRQKWDRHEPCGNGGYYLEEMYIPWEMILPHEKQSKKNHKQTLQRISERGGFSRCEAIAILEDREWTMIECEDADRKLREMVRLWKEKNV